MTAPLLIAIHGVKRAGKGTVATSIAEWGRPLGLSARDRGFADYVKWAAARLFFPDIEMDDAVKWADEFKDDPNCVVILDNHNGFIRQGSTRIHIPLRQFLQRMGTEVGRDLFGDDFWVNLLLPKEAHVRDPEGWRGSFLTEPKTPEDWPYSIADLCTVSDLRFESGELERFDFLRHEEDISVESSLFVPARVFKIKVRRKEAEQAIIDQARNEGRDIHRSELGIPDDKFDYVVNNDDTIEELNMRIRTIMNEIHAKK